MSSNEYRVRGFYGLMAWLTVMVVPLGPSILFAYKAYQSALEMIQTQAWLAVLSAVATAFALESVGVLTGHMLVRAMYRKNTAMSAGLFVLLCAYVGLGVYELWGTIGAVSFLVAPLGYVVVGLRELDADMEAAKGKRDDLASESKVREIEHRRRLELLREENQHREKLAALSVANTATRAVAEVAGNPIEVVALAARNGTLYRILPEVKGTKKRIAGLLERNDYESYTELAAELGLSRPAATKHVKQLAEIIQDGT